MDPEIAFIELGQDGNESPTNSTSFFQTNLEQRIGMIGSGVVIALSLLAIAYLVMKIRHQDRRMMSPTTSGSRLVACSNGGMFDKNLELQAEFPYSQLSNEE